MVRLKHALTCAGRDVDEDSMQAALQAAMLVDDPFFNEVGFLTHKSLKHDIQWVYMYGVVRANIGCVFRSASPS